MQIPLSKTGVGRSGLPLAIQWPRIDRSKAAAGGTKIGRLPLVEAGGHPLDLALVGIIAQIEFQYFGRFTAGDRSLSRSYQRLGHVMSGQNILPDAPCDLVTTVGRAAAIPGSRLEEQALALGPEQLGLVALYQSGARNAVQQDCAGCSRNAQLLQRGFTAQQDQVALVCIQGVRPWVGCQHGSIGQVGLQQVVVAGRLEQKVGQAVVNHIDCQFVVPQSTITKFKFARISDDRPYIVLGEQPLEHEELGIQVLLLRIAVDYGDASQWSVVTGQPPFLAEHGDDCGLEMVCLGRGWNQAGYFGAAGQLSTGHQRIEHGAAGVGIDLDQTESVGRSMKVVAHEDALGAVVPLGGGGRAAQDLLAVGRQCDNRFDGGDQLLHALHMAG